MRANRILRIGISLVLALSVLLIQDVGLPAHRLCNAAVVPVNTQASAMLSGKAVSYPFSFVVLADCRRDDAQNSLNPIFTTILDEIAALSTKPYFVIIGGDFVHDGTEGQHIVFHDCVSSWMSSTGIPLFLAPGNHEFDAENAFTHYATYAGTQLDYYFDFGNYRFMIINNVQHPDDPAYQIDNDQLASVEAWLESAPPNRFAFVHIPLVRLASGGGLVNNPGHQAFHDLLNDYRAACFCAHNHLYSRDMLDSVNYITTAGGGAQLRYDLLGYEVEDLPIYLPPLRLVDYHWLLVTVDASGNVSVEMHLKDVGHNATAQQFDFNFTIDSTPPTMTIAEAEGGYYKEALTFTSISFDDTIALDDGWYQMDSYSGNWTALFTDLAATSWSSDNWTIPDFGGLAEGSHTIYFKASDNVTNVEGEEGEWSWQFHKDTIPPTDATSVNSTSHTPSVWSTDSTVDITWTAASDNTSGLDGYSILWDTNPTTIPDPTKVLEEGATSANSTALADGNSHYFHIRSVDNAGNWQSTVHLGPFFIDANPPTMESIAEPQGQYFNTDPVFASISFNDGIALDDGWYQIDSCSGNWTVLFTDVAATSWSSANWTIPGFSALSGSSHTIYFKASDNATNVEGEAGEWSWQFYKGTPPRRGGGGGGGGGGGAEEREPSGITKVASSVSPDGVFMGDVSAESGDGKVTLDIEEGTTGLTEEGEPLSEISITEMEAPPPPPEGADVIGLTYDLGPDGATFDPPITLTFTYDPDDIPAGVNEEELVIATWDEELGEWVVLEGCTVDPVTHTITVPISHFTAFAVLALPRPAAFSTTDLGISPTQVNTGETVTISVLVTNAGDLAGDYEVILNIDGVAIATEDVTLAGGDSQTITFTTSKGVAGTYTVEVNGLSGTFTVRTPPPPAAAPPVPPTAPAASFTVSDLSVTPGEVEPGQQILVSATVTNTGGGEGSYIAILKINGAEEARKAVTLGPDRSETVTFTTAKDTEGSYTVSIDDEIGRFNVIALPPVAELPVEPTAPANWPLIGGVVGGVVVLALVLWLAVFRRRFRRA